MTRWELRPFFYADAGDSAGICLRPAAVRSFPDTVPVLDFFLVPGSDSPQGIPFFLHVSLRSRGGLVGSRAARLVGLPEQERSARSSLPRDVGGSESTLAGWALRVTMVRPPLRSPHVRVDQVLGVWSRGQQRSAGPLGPLQVPSMPPPSFLLLQSKLCADSASASPTLPACTRAGGCSS